MLSGEPPSVDPSVRSEQLTTAAVFDVELIQRSVVVTVTTAETMNDNGQQAFCAEDKPPILTNFHLLNSNTISEMFH